MPVVVESGRVQSWTMAEYVTRSEDTLRLQNRRLGRRPPEPWRRRLDTIEDERLRRVCYWAAASKAGPSRPYPGVPREPLPVSRRVVRDAEPRPPAEPHCPSARHLEVLEMARRGAISRAVVTRHCGPVSRHVLTWVARRLQYTVFRVNGVVVWAKTRDDAAAHVEEIHAAHY